ncbi:MAG: hypothetical protein ACREJU_11820 [Nitrospiraceae bacterium]
MAQQGTVGDRILKAVQRAPGCQLDHLAVSLPDLTWNQVFLEVDRMSRTGQVRVQSSGNGDYTLALPHSADLHPKPRARVPRHDANASRG